MQVFVQVLLRILLLLAMQLRVFLVLQFLSAAPRQLLLAAWLWLVATASSAF